MRINIDFVDNATPRFRAISEGLSRKLQLNRAAAEGAVVPVLRNFRAMASSNHNSLGAPSSGFWQRMQAGTFTDADEEAGYVRMPREIALRYFGGTVTPKNASLLAIPARTEAYNKSPRDFADLRLIFFTKPDSSKTMALAQADQQAINYRKTKKGLIATKGAVKGGLVYYWLVPSATIAGNRDVLPPQDQLARAASRGGAAYLSLVMKGAQ